MTEEEEERHYDAYKAAERAILESKEILKLLRKQGEAAALLAKEAHPICGLSSSELWKRTIRERSDAMRAAWRPFHEEIARVEAKIESLRSTANQEFDLVFKR
jgi:hypothetical protein